MKMKNIFKISAYLLVLCLVTFAYSPKAEAALVPINSFADLANSSVPVVSVGMPTGTNLMVRDPITSVDSVVDMGSHWYMGFINYSESDATVVGYAENTWRNVEGYSGKMVGKYLETIDEGSRPDDVWTVEDVDADGIAVYDDITQNLTFDSDDNFYFSNDMLINGIQGGVGQLPARVTSGSIYIPEMVVNPVPEPATIFLFGLGGLLFRKFKERR